MKYFISILLILSLVTLGGCGMGQSQSQKPSEMNPEDLPDVRAFQDEFTRDFLQSTEETREGYYPFLSGTGKYKMDFPAEGKITERAYAVREKNHEEFPTSILKDDGTGSMFTLYYYSSNRKEDVQFHLDSFKKRIGNDVKFQKEESDGQTLYYAYFERNDFQTLVGYVQNEVNEGGIEVDYARECQEEQQGKCKKNKNEYKKTVLEWMKSIKFTNGSE